MTALPCPIHRRQRVYIQGSAAKQQISPTSLLDLAVYRYLEMEISLCSMTLAITAGVVGQSLDFHSLYYLDSICAKNKIKDFRKLHTVVLV